MSYYVFSLLGHYYSIVISSHLPLFCLRGLVRGLVGQVVLAPAPARAEAGWRVLSEEGLWSHGIGER